MDSKHILCSTTLWARARQVVAARSLLGWTGTRLAEAAGHGKNTINRLETGPDDLTGSSVQVVKDVRDALERAGATFIDGPEGSYGVLIPPTAITPAKDKTMKYTALACATIAAAIISFPLGMGVGTGFRLQGNEADPYQSSEGWTVTNASIHATDNMLKAQSASMELDEKLRASHYAMEFDKSEACRVLNTRLTEIFVHLIETEGGLLPAGNASDMPPSRARRFAHEMETLANQASCDVSMAQLSAYAKASFTINESQNGK